MSVCRKKNKILRRRFGLPAGVNYRILKKELCEIKIYDCLWYKYFFLFYKLKAARNKMLRLAPWLYLFIALTINVKSEKVVIVAFHKKRI